MKELELATLKEFNRIAKQNFIPEQNPKETIKHLKNFFNKYV